MDVIPFLKGNSINEKKLSFILIFKSPFLNDAPKSLKPIDFWNSLELSSGFLRERFWVFHFLQA